MKNYKNYIIVASAAALLVGCQGNKSATNGEDGYTIQGKLNNATAGSNIYLFELDKQQFVPRDTVAVGENGTFNFEGEIAEPSFYRVTIDQRDGVILVLDKATNVKLEADAKDLNGTSKIEGSDDSKLFQELNKMVNETQMQKMELEQRFMQANNEGKTEEAEAIKKEYDALQVKIKKFLAQHPTSVVSTFGTLTLIDPATDFAFADSMSTLFSKNLPNSKYTSELNERLKGMRSTAVGQMAPEITLPTPDGGSASLSSLRGKYVLIDFWASWCGPCRKENPNVVRMYNAYKDKGFEIFGVSLDQNRDKWLKAIADDKLTWPHVSDLKGWESAAAGIYNITAIPQTLLLDKEGRIIAKNLRGKELEAKLAEVLN
ncbi:AhpC/TSA family protein [Pontibacter sp. BT310]|uniref:AhpC/TSA family protein n=1 Tax=Pontibacter populi TaxID=890055 RepID=A0ABS6XGT6_9BACT|nr:MULTISPECIES: TlpA disulfide reductase family protein [Pontibacter]MBJ6120026.1 AhpC/TSA family protein [Pontibacter sp. BT310]MBR0572455.1 AhpC/TSA family protein [Microvirga sp. STS03]MBW3366879.1 AhpC/TSA family protein [Pontibacter populi]